LVVRRTKRLDIGSGTLPTGDVNCDLDPTTKPTVCCDAHFLPFREKIFGIAYSASTIEHVRHPSHMLHEMERVSSRVMVLAPHWLSRYAKAPTHLWSFHVSWFTKQGYSCKIKLAEFRFLIFGYTRINEIEATKNINECREVD
jgi:hypothetical protein